MMGSAYGSYGKALGQAAEYESQMAAWEAKNDFATHLAGIGGVAGINPGNLNPGSKPSDAGALAVSGQLGRSAQEEAFFARSPFMGQIGDMVNNGKRKFGSSEYLKIWQQPGALDTAKGVAGAPFSRGGEALQGFGQSMGVIPSEQNQGQRQRQGEENQFNINREGIDDITSRFNR
jgi:hypothetical protein